MHRVITVVVVVVAATLGAGCGTECVDDFDCGIGNTCAGGFCEVNGGGGGNGNPPPGGEGEGEGEGQLFTDIVDDLDAPVSMLLPSSDLGGIDPNVVVVGQYDPVGRVDVTTTFDVVTGTFVPDLFFEIDVLNETRLGESGRCNVDTVTLERDVDPQGADELWWTCGIPGVGLQQTLTTDLLNDITVPGAAGADLILRLVNADALDLDIKQRRAFARRGTAGLFIEQVTNGLADRVTVRARDIVSIGFGEIAGLSLISETDDSQFGDIILVFDRAHPGAGGLPALVPLERQNLLGGAKAWALAQSPWRILPLPATTHAVRVVGEVPNPADLDVDAAEQATVNLEVYLPVEGRVAFARLESEMVQLGAFNPDLTGFTVLEFEPGISDRPTAAPSSEDRILILPVPGAADTVFYVTTNEAFGWRLLLHRSNTDNFNNNVARAEFFNQNTDRPTAMVTIPGDSSNVWIGVAGLNELHPIFFDPNN